MTLLTCKDDLEGHELLALEGQSLTETTFAAITRNTESNAMVKY